MRVSVAQICLQRCTLSQRGCRVLGLVCFSGVLGLVCFNGVLGLVCFNSALLLPVRELCWGMGSSVLFLMMDLAFRTTLIVTVI